MDHPNDDDEGTQGTKRGRGRPPGSTKTLYYWTQVLSLTHRMIDTSKKFDIAEDLEQEKATWEEEEADEWAVDAPIFHSKTFFTNDEIPKLEEYQLTEE